MTAGFRRLALIGCGHIGGSLSLALRWSGLVGEVVGYDVDPGAGARALELDICDRIEGTASAAVAGADAVVVAVPVRSVVATVRELAGALAPDALVTDVGSTKLRIVRECEELIGTQFVGGHPMAGTERSGPESATAGLFQDRLVMLTPTCNTAPAALERISAMWRATGAQVELVDPDKHDDVVTRIPHLPHVAAYALVNAIARRGAADLVGLAGGGFRDTTRVASTAPGIWVDILCDNRDRVLPLIDDYIAELRSLADAIRNESDLAPLLARANHARKEIVGP